MVNAQLKLRETRSDRRPLSTTAVRIGAQRSSNASSDRIRCPAAQSGTCRPGKAPSGPVRRPVAAQHSGKISRATGITRQRPPTTTVNSPVIGLVRGRMAGVSTRARVGLFYFIHGYWTPGRLDFCLKFVATGIVGNIVACMPLLPIAGSRLITMKKDFHKLYALHRCVFYSNLERLGTENARCSPALLKPPLV